MKIGVVTFPGSLDDRDAARAVRLAGGDPVALWHGDDDLKGVDAVVLPGGFSYGDYLRCGAIARFSPVMQAVVRHAEAGKPVIGICNGFQILIEAGLLPGGLIRNTGLKFVCRYVNLRVETADTPFTGQCAEGDVLRIVVKHNEGNYTVDPATFEKMKANDQIVVRYVNAAGERVEGANPNGSLDDIAGVCNEARNVFGMMPHPENSVEAELAGGADGRRFFGSKIDALRGAEVRA